MTHEVIMPALGMAQDTGLIVAWCKAPGDAVAAGDVLMEVETDKAVMEVAAGQDGYVAELRAEAGENVPVGDVVAVITADKPDAPVQRKSAAGKAVLVFTRDDEPTEPAAKEQEPAPAPVKPAAVKPAAPASATSAVPPGGRILASPKARRLAAECGLDLARLAAEGHPQPYHADDLNRLAALPYPAGAAASSRIEAHVARNGYEAFLTWFAEETGGPADGLAILSAFAAAALREAAGALEGPLLVSAERPGARRVLYADPDMQGLAGMESDESGTPTLVLRDLTGSCITAMCVGADAVPVLTVADGVEGYAVTLDIPAGALHGDAAVVLISDLAARLEMPLRQLL